MSTSVKILGIPYDGSSSFMRGPAEGPTNVRNAVHSYAANYWAETGMDTESLVKQGDLGDLEFPSEDPETVMSIIEEKVQSVLNEGHHLLSIGGDHFITYPIIKAYAQKYPELHLLQIDAHGDLYDHLDGNRYSHACPFARIMENGLASSLTQIGIRTMNAHQWEQARRFGVEVVEMKDFHQKGMPKLKGPLYISLDLDAFDPAFAPGVSHHEPGGFSTRDVLEVIHAIDVPIVGADIVELNPRRDPIGMTAMLAAKLLKELIVKF